MKSCRKKIATEIESQSIELLRWCETVQTAFSYVAQKFSLDDNFPLSLAPGRSRVARKIFTAESRPTTTTNIVCLWKFNFSLIIIIAYTTRRRCRWRFFVCSNVDNFSTLFFPSSFVRLWNFHTKCELSLRPTAIETSRVCLWRVNKKYLFFLTCDHRSSSLG